MDAREYLSEGQTILSNLFIKNFRKLGLTSEEFVLWLQVFMYKEKGESFIDFQLVANDLELPVQQVYQQINQLITKGMLSLQSERDSSGQMRDRFLLEPAYEKLAALIRQKKSQQTAMKNEDKIKNMYALFESEFGRPLSSIEFQRIQQWQAEDGYSVELIELALKEAVLNQAYNFNYIDRILLAWERKNIRTKQQVDAAQKDRKRKQLQNSSDHTLKEAIREVPTITLHNWLEEGNND